MICWKDNWSERNNWSFWGPKNVRSKSKNWKFLNCPPRISELSKLRNSETKIKLYFYRLFNLNIWSKFPLICRWPLISIALLNYIRSSFLLGCRNLFHFFSEAYYVFLELGGWTKIFFWNSDSNFQNSNFQNQNFYLGNKISFGQLG